MGRPLTINVGDTFGDLTVLEELPRRVQPSGQTKRMFSVSCKCGSIAEVLLGNLTSGHTISCGCVSIKHGGALNKERLYSCWRHMKARVSARNACNLHPDWEDYTTFKVWALNNGYTDNLVLCRQGDVGDYAPNNVRWDTQASNAEEGFSKGYILTDPSGKTYHITNMSKFCKSNGLTAPCLHAVISGRQNSHKGWTAMVDDTADMDFDDL